MLNTLLMDDVRRTFDVLRRSMDEFFGSVWTASTFDGSESTFAPNFEAGWTGDRLNLRVVLPGVSEKDVKVTVQGNQLLVEGERKAPENFSHDGFSSVLPYGRFYRAISLPAGLDLDKVSGRLHDGVLDIEIPVKEEMKPRVIAIEGAESRKALPV
ncbi:MAG TPA: Hsp20 family protein [Bryobacterales bacterium]|jgi:HSP20 family protein|nr:Hsp20 family protein [Bryobacterales bacterium]